MSYILHRNLRTIPPTIARGKGLLMQAADGQTVIDASGGAAVACLGHGDTRVVEAIARQAESMAYAHTGFFTSDVAEELAEHLVGAQPGGLRRVCFVSSGSEAMEAALKMGRQYFLEIGQPKRRHFIARRQSYHGNTLGALALGGNMARREPYSPLLGAGFSHVSPCFPYREQDEDESDANYVARLAGELEAEFQRIGPDQVIAFVAETMVGATIGCVAALPGYFGAIREVCDRHGALLILDEVMCGMGRTGSLHAWEQEGVTPDIQAIAKGLGGGYQPIGAILLHGRVVDALERGSGTVMHGQTYQGHPVACAAALAVQRIIEDDDLLANVATMGERLGSGLMARFSSHRNVGDIRGRGLFWAVEFVENRQTHVSFNRSLNVNGKLKQAALAAGLAVYPMSGTVDGHSGDHIILAPAYNLGEGEIDVIIDRLGGAIENVFGIRTC